MKTILAKYNETISAATGTVAGDSRTRPGREMLKRQAAAALPALREELLGAFRKVGFPIFLVGPGVELFLEEANKLAETVYVDFAQAASHIHEAVVASVGHRNREFSPANFSVMLREIRQAAVDLGLTSIPDIKYDGPVFLKDSPAVVACVNEYILKYLGPEFLGGIIEKKALGQVRTLTCEAPVVPVLISGLTPSLQDRVGPKLFQGKFLSAEADAGTNEKTVTEVFKKIRKAQKE